MVRPLTPVRPITHPTTLDIDHLVPLKDAHDPDGWTWDKNRKSASANDVSQEDYLIGVTASANRRSVPDELRSVSWPTETTGAVTPSTGCR